MRLFDILYFTCITLLSFITLCSCASKPSRLPPSTSIEMDTLLITAGQEEAIHESELFSDGVGALEGQNFDQCELILKRYLRVFPTGKHVHDTYYNLGLCLELQHKYAEAISYFENYALLSTQKTDRLDGRVRQGYNLVYAHKARQAIELYDALLTKENLSGFNRAECHLRRAMAYIKLRQLGEAEHDLSSAISHINGSIGSFRKGNEALAEVEFQRGELYHQYMRRIALKMPPDRMKRLLSEKIRFFRKSLYAYITAIKVQNIYWALAAGHRLGVLHEGIYLDLLHAEYPKFLDEEMLGYYYYELDKKLAPLITEAIHIYEKTLTISATHGLETKWVSDTQKNLKRMRLLEEEVMFRLAFSPEQALILRRDAVSRESGPPTPTMVEQSKLTIRDRAKLLLGESLGSTN